MPFGRPVHSVSIHSHVAGVEWQPGRRDCDPAGSCCMSRARHLGRSIPPLVRSVSRSRAHGFMIWQFLTPVRIALLLAAALGVLRFQGCLYLHLTDVRAMDYRLLQRGIERPGPEVVIVAIDDASLEDVGRWPWPRSVVAKLVEQISAAQPAVIGFDIVFSEPSAFEADGRVSARPDNVPMEAWRAVQATLRMQDELLATAIRASQRAVLGYFFDFDGTAVDGITQGVPSHNLVHGTPDGSGEHKIPTAHRARVNLPELAAAARGSGYFDVIPDPGDGAVRRVPLVVRLGRDMALPLSLATLRVFRPDATLGLFVKGYGVESIRFGSTVIPVAEDGQMLINYRGPGKTFPHYSASRLIAEGVAPETLRDRIVLVGITAKAVQDIRVTPFDAVFPGVELHANVIDNILQRQFIRQPRWLVLVDVAAIVTLALSIGLAMRRLRGIAAAVMAAVVLAAYLVASQGVFVAYGLPLTVVYGLLCVSLTYAGVAVQHYMTEEREKRKMRKALELYLSPSMVRIVSEQPERLKLGGEKRELTVFFSDIRGFTSISEKLAPEILVELLNDYLGAMTGIVFRHDGMLDKYIGDAVMALWGAPLPQVDHAARACRAALEMVARLRELNREWEAKGWPRLDIGAGLNTGPMVFGNMGSAQHLSLTVMGDNVNLGSRLEGLNKLYGTNVIASEETVRAAAGGFATRELDLVRVKGKRLPVRIFELLGPASERQTWAALVERFDAGLAAYRARSWGDARELFATVLQDRPQDGPARLYTARCAAMIADPPGPNWDGVTVMDTK